MTSWPTRSRRVSRASVLSAQSAGGVLAVWLGGPTDGEDCGAVGDPVGAGPLDGVDVLQPASSVAATSDPAAVRRSRTVREVIAPRSSTDTMLPDL